MKTISISIDGLPNTHDHFRQTLGGFRNAMDGIQNLISANKFKHIQITTVVTHENIHELPELKKMFDTLDIDSWRIINIEPIGRACSLKNMMLTKEDYQYMFDFIINMRKTEEPVCYGCSRYLGTNYEHKVRDWNFLCIAGIHTASITSSGDIAACLDVERRPELIQGNIVKDKLVDVWNNKFKIFRQNLSDQCPTCQNCSVIDKCLGGSFHSWNFKENRPNICFKDILF